MPTISFLSRFCKPLAGMLAIPLAIGCSNPFSNGDCTALGVSGITATVVDATTKLAPAAIPILRIEDGTYVEEHATPYAMSDPPSYSGAVERPGTYRVIVRAAGYQDYVMENVRVTRGGHCNALAGVRLNVALVRAS